MIDFGNVGDLVKLIVAKGFMKLHKVQCIDQSDHTACLVPIQELINVWQSVDLIAF